jgi:hypothetical protein
MDESGDLAINALVDFFVRTIDVFNTSMADELFCDKCRQVEAHDIWPGQEIPHGGNLVINLKIICPAELFKEARDLFLDIVFAICLNEPFFYELH